MANKTFSDIFSGQSHTFVPVRVNSHTEGDVWKVELEFKKRDGELPVPFPAAATQRNLLPYPTEGQVKPRWIPASRALSKPADAQSAAGPHRFHKRREKIVIADRVDSGVPFPMMEPIFLNKGDFFPSIIQDANTIMPSPMPGLYGPFVLPGGPRGMRNPQPPAYHHPFMAFAAMPPPPQKEDLSSSSSYLSASSNDRAEAPPPAPVLRGGLPSHPVQQAPPQQQQAGLARGPVLRSSPPIVQEVLNYSALAGPSSSSRGARTDFNDVFDDEMFARERVREVMKEELKSQRAIRERERSMAIHDRQKHAEEEIKELQKYFKEQHDIIQRIRGSAVVDSLASRNSTPSLLSRPGSGRQKEHKDPRGQLGRSPSDGPVAQSNANQVLTPTEAPVARDYSQESEGSDLEREAGSITHPQTLYSLPQPPRISSPPGKAPRSVDQARTGRDAPLRSPTLSPTPPATKALVPSKGPQRGVSPSDTKKNDGYYSMDYRDSNGRAPGYRGFIPPVTPDMDEDIRSRKQQGLAVGYDEHYTDNSGNRVSSPAFVPPSYSDSYTDPYGSRVGDHGFKPPRDWNEGNITLDSGCYDWRYMDPWGRRPGEVGFVPPIAASAGVTPFTAAMKFPKGYDEFYRDAHNRRPGDPRFTPPMPVDPLTPTHKKSAAEEKLIADQEEISRNAEIKRLLLMNKNHSRGSPSNADESRTAKRRIPESPPSPKQFNQNSTTTKTIESELQSELTRMQFLERRVGAAMQSPAPYLSKKMVVFIECCAKIELDESSTRIEIQQTEHKEAQQMRSFIDTMKLSEEEVYERQLISDLEHRAREEIMDSSSTNYYVMSEFAAQRVTDAAVLHKKKKLEEEEARKLQKKRLDEERMAQEETRLKLAEEKRRAAAEQAVKQEHERLRGLSPSIAAYIALHHGAFHKVILLPSPPNAVCAISRVPIPGGEGVNGNGRNYNSSSLLCGLCLHSLYGESCATVDTFDGVFVHERCAAKCCKSMACAKCGDSIKDNKWLDAEGSKYHLNCWVCSKCGLPFGDKTGYRMDGGNPYHEECMPRSTKLVNRDQPCIVCGKPATGKRFTIEGKKVHVNCFRCTYCNELLSAETPFEMEGDEFFHIHCLDKHR